MDDGENFKKGLIQALEIVNRQDVTPELAGKNSVTCKILVQWL